MHDPSECKKNAELYIKAVNEQTRLVYLYQYNLKNPPPLWRIFKRRSHNIHLDNLKTEIEISNRKCKYLQHQLFETLGLDWLAKLITAYKERENYAHSTPYLWDEM
jgi:hypothetical protein